MGKRRDGPPRRFNQRGRALHTLGGKRGWRPIASGADAGYLRSPNRASMMKPVWAKSAFWSRLAGFHPAIRGAALATAFQSGRIFKRYGAAAAAPPGLVFPESAATTAHPFWAHAFASGASVVGEMLEIGAFEGRTTTFAARLFPNARITCIDPWAEYAEMTDLLRAEDCFRRNIADVQTRIRPIKGQSSLILPQLLDQGERFDVIFIDGSHAYADVVIDSQFGWRLLKPGGVLIWDDYLWRKTEYGRRVPKLAIDQFLTANSGQFTPLWAFKQVAIRKNGPSPA